MKSETRICTRCVLDNTVPDIAFDENGVCNYCRQFDAIAGDSFNDFRGDDYLNELISNIKKKDKGRKYDVIVGVSGGVDSTFLVQYAVKNGLRVLAVNFDNGWHSEIAVSNIRNILEKLGVDLITYVVEYDEMKDLLLSYMKAGLPWVDIPTDLALMATLYKVASDSNVKTIFVGNSFRTEGKQPTEWTHGDTKQLRFIAKKFGKKEIKTFPMLSPFKLLYYGAVKGIKMVRPFNYITYDKASARAMLEKEYGWRDYGGHHHESAFTKFAIAYWLPKKFQIDKRKITYSAQVRSGLLSRDIALGLLTQQPYDPNLMEEDKNYVIKKLGITPEQFEDIWKAPNRTIYDYPSYLPLFNKYLKHALFIFKYILPFKPMMGYELKE
jgi:N-acetyl sugar amidotransferase